MKKEAEALSKLADGALAAQGGPNDFDVTWAGEDFLKGPKGKAVRSLHRHARSRPRCPAAHLVLYWRVVPAAAAAGCRPKRTTTRGGAGLGSALAYVSPPDGAEPAAAQPLVRGPGRHVRRVRRRRKSCSREGAEERAASEDSRAQADGERPRLLEQRADDELGHRCRTNRAAGGAAHRAAADRAAVRRLGVMEIIPAPSTKLIEESRVVDLLPHLQPEGRRRQQAGHERSNTTSARSRPAISRRRDEPCKAGEKFYNKTDPQALNGHDAAAAVRPQAGTPAPDGTGGSAGGVPPGRLPARDQGD